MWRMDGERQLVRVLVRIAMWRRGRGVLCSGGKVGQEGGRGGVELGQTPRKDFL